MDIIIYDKNMKRVGAIGIYSSLIWTRKYYETGTFELHVPLTTTNMNLLLPGNIVYKKDAKEAGIIEDRNIQDTAKAKKIVVKGRFLSSILNRRMIYGLYSFNGKAEVAMRNLVTSVTALPLLELGSIQNFNETITFQVENKELLSTLVNIAKTSGFGFRVKPDFTLRKMYFEVYKGVDRTSLQLVNNRVIFSERHGNLNEISYTYNDQLLKTVAIVEGKNANDEKVQVTVGDTTGGMDRRETYIQATDVNASDFENNEQFLEALKQKGLEKLNSYAIKESYEYETNPTGNFEYKKHYDLGDIVTIEKIGWGLSEDKRITEIQEVYEDGGMTVIPTLGDPMGLTVDWSRNV